MLVMAQIARRETTAHAPAERRGLSGVLRTATFLRPMPTTGNCGGIPRWAPSRAHGLRDGPGGGPPARPNGRNAPRVALTFCERQADPPSRRDRSGRWPQARSVPRTPDRAAALDRKSVV